MMTNQEIQALCPTLSERPPVYYDLVRKLVSDGFYHHHQTAEWIKPSDDGSIPLQGIICWQGAHAWLRHHDDCKKKYGETSHRI